MVLKAVSAKVESEVMDIKRVFLYKCNITDANATRMCSFLEMCAACSFSLPSAGIFFARSVLLPQGFRRDFTDFEENDVEIPRFRR